MSGMKARTLGPAAAFYGLLAVVGTAWIWGRDGQEGWLLFLPRRPWADLAIGLGSGAAVVLVSTIASECCGWARRMEEAFHYLLGPMRAPTALALAILSGVGEELLFRGGLQITLADWWGSPWGAAIAAGTLFGAIHVPLRRGMGPWPIFAAAIGILMGAALIWTGSLVAPVLIHATVNFVNLVRIGRWREEDDEQRSPALPEPPGGAVRE